MKDNFYIFLDIDGVLWDWKFLLDKIKAKETLLTDFKFKPESVDALNYLIYCIDDKYDAKLVISSTWRADMFLTKSALYKNGLIYNKEMESTPVLPLSIPKKRGSEIRRFLEQKNEMENYVVIDNNEFDFAKTLNMDKFIKTNGKYESLTYDLVDKFLEKNTDIIENFTDVKENSSEKFRYNSKDFEELTI